MACTISASDAIPDTAARTLRQTGSFFTVCVSFSGCGRDALILRQCRLRLDRAAAGRNHILGRDRIWQHVARNAVRGRRVEAVAGEKRSRRSFCDDIAVKEQGAAVGVFRAEFNVVADHEDRHAGRLQRPQNLPENSA